MNRRDKNTLPPDLYSRNATIAYIAQKITAGSQLRVLDVGGFQGKLVHFFPEDTDYTILDILPRPQNEEALYVQADARKIPYSDNNFDIVVASDMLEHVEKPHRAPIIRELLRVSKNHVILGVPCENELLETAEQNIREQFKRITGAEHPFLIEHTEFGLPREDKLEEVLRKEGVNYAMIKEGNLMNWYIQQLYAAVQNGMDMQDKKFGFYRYFNDHLHELGNLRAPTYRTLFVIAKSGPIPEQEIHQELQQRNTWKPRRFMEVLQRAFDDLRLVIQERGGSSAEVQALQEQVTELHKQNENSKQLLGSTKATVKEQEKKLGKARQAIETYRSAIEEVRVFLHEKENTITYLKDLLQEKDERITTLEQAERELRTERNKQEKFLRQLTKELDEKEEKLERLRGYVKSNERTVREQADELSKSREHIRALEADLGSHQRELRAVLDSRAWKLVMLYGRLKKAVWTRPVTLIKRGWDILTNLGPRVFWQRLKRKLKRQQVDENPYKTFVRETQPTPEAERQAGEEVRSFSYRPRISIVMPTYNIEETLLRKAIDSVRNQWYPNWELCICDDASTDQTTKNVLDEYAQQDERIKVTYRAKNGGIVKASNDALELATGEYVGFLDNDDELTPDALYEVVRALQETKYDLLYSDEDKLDADHNRCDPFFKPDWSPDLLLSHNYICHFSVYRASILKDLGGLREGFDGSQDYDLVLRFTEKTNKVKHIPKILYHWRKVPGSTAAEVDAKPYAFDAARKALADAVTRRGINADISDGQWTGSYRVHRKIETRPLVSIIIPFKDKVEVLKPCVNSILIKSTWQNYEILLVNNRSELYETEEYLESIANHPKIRQLTYDRPFNFSAINNFAAKQAKGEYLILLNNDTEVITPGWIEAMLEHAQRPEVGAVGAKLLFPNDQVQHAGVLIGVGGVANHAFLKSHAPEHGYFGQKNVVKNYSAVTGACMMVRKQLYQEVGGLNEKDLGVSFNDIDFCLRLRDKGYLIVYTPYARLYHYESLTRGYEVAMKEVKYMQERHRGLFEKGDPYYNRNLSRERFDFSLEVEDKVRG